MKNEVFKLLVFFWYLDLLTYVLNPECRALNKDSSAAIRVLHSLAIAVKALVFLLDYLDLLKLGRRISIRLGRWDIIELGLRLLNPQLGRLNKRWLIFVRLRQKGHLSIRLLDRFLVRLLINEHPG